MSSKADQIQRIGSLVNESITANARAVAAERRATEAEAKLAALPPPAPPAPPAPVAPAPPVDPLVAINAIENPLFRSVARAEHHLSRETHARLTGAAKR